MVIQQTWKQCLTYKTVQLWCRKTRHFVTLISSLSWTKDAILHFTTDHKFLHFLSLSVVLFISNNVKYRLCICYSGHNQEWRWPWLLASGRAWISWTADSSLGILSPIFKYSFTEQLSVSSVWSGRGHCITTTRLGQVQVPGQHRSYFRTPDRHLTKKLRLWRPLKRGQSHHSTLLWTEWCYSILPGWVLSLIGGCASRIPGPVCSRGNAAPGGRQNVCFHQ